MSTAATPAVSIVVTAYNAERYIGACVQAALAQTFRDLEVVVLDDGSTDTTAQICASITDPRVRFLSRPRIGRCRALNEAVAAARGAYIAINDADDLSLPQRVEYTLAFLHSHPQLAYVGTGFLATDAFQELSATAPAELVGSEGVIEWPSRAAVYRRNLFNNSTLMYPKTTWQRIGGYDEQLTNSEDYDFYLRALQCGPAALLPGKTVLWYTNPDGFFKHKSKREHLRAIGVIKRRAHRLLGLPAWLQGYHLLWLAAFELTQRYPRLIGVANALRRRRRRRPLTTVQTRVP
jgi:glycosyltransferase involved in cell wall biosynthesis